MDRGASLRGSGAKGRGGHGNRSRKPFANLSQDQMHNAKLERFYAGQGLLSDAELTEHFDSLRKTLPVTFRITGSRIKANSTRDYARSCFISKLDNLEFEGEQLEPPQVIPWYPRELAYKLNVTKSALRKVPEFKQFHTFIVNEVEAGNIVRQEAVSMIPPLFMDIKPHHACLDMCAAPGSKTSQIVEYLHADVSNPTGLVVANDSNFQRAYMLVHQVKRLNSPNFVVTNHDATYINNFHLDKGKKQVLKFDRILADVPCSGDGTLRKNVNLWRDWTPGSGLALHATQVSCLRRGLQMLKVGGRLVYSTCSLNPIEDEAVLAAVLDQWHGCAHLVDVSAQYPDLKRRPGVLHWKVSDWDGTWVSTLDEVREQKRAKFPITAFAPTEDRARELHLDRAMRVYPHLDDTGGFFIAVIEKTQEFSGSSSAIRAGSSAKRSTSDPLSQCEIASHSDSVKKPKITHSGATQVIAKRDPADSESTTPMTDAWLPQSIETQCNAEELGDVETSDHAASNQAGYIEKPTLHKPNTNVSAQAPLAQSVNVDTSNSGLSADNSLGKAGRSLNDEYFIYLARDSPAVASAIRYYNFADEVNPSCFLTRNATGEAVRSIYYTSPLLKQVLEANHDRMRFVSAGLRCLAKQNLWHGDAKAAEHDASLELCEWRITNEAVSVLSHGISSARRVVCDFDELDILLSVEFPKTERFPRDESVDGSLRQQLHDRMIGCYIVTCDLRNDDRAVCKEVIELPLWKSVASIQVMLAKKEKIALYSRVTGKLLPPSEKEIAGQRKTQARRDPTDERSSTVHEVIDAGHKSKSQAQQTESRKSPPLCS
ncbi:tRNA (cytosine-5-)-methyltransferase ncl1 [Savitreella phatthalungensis]